MPLTQHPAICAYPNPVAADVAAITAGSEGATMTAAKLKTKFPWDFARLTSIFPHLSWWAVDYGESVSVQALALDGHNLVPGSLIRAVGVASGALPPVRSETLAPLTIAAQSNLLIGEDTLPDILARINEHPAAADGLIAEALDVGEDWSVRLTFADPAETPATGAAHQAFAIWVNGVGNAGATPDDYARCNAKLFESGVERADLGTKVLKQGGSLLVFSWDAAALGTPNGSAVELLLTFTHGSSGTVNAELDSAAWDCLHQSDVTGLALDTGWDTITGFAADPAWANTSQQRVVEPPPLWFKLLDSAVSLEQFRIEFKTDGHRPFGTFLTTPPRDPVTTIDAGVLLAGPIVQLPSRFSPGGALTQETKTVGSSASITGSNLVVVQWARRRCELEFAYLPESFAAELFARLGRDRENCFLLALQPTASHAQVLQNETFYARVEECRGVAFPQDGMLDGERTRAMAFTFVEQL